MLNIKKIKPLNTQIITTADRYLEDQTISGSKLVDSKRSAGALKEYQKVIAVGTFVRDVKVGDLVMINPRYYAQRKHEEGSLKDGVIMDNPVVRYNIPMIEMDHKKYLMLQDRDIDFVIEQWEEEEEKEESPLIIPNTDIIA